MAAVVLEKQNEVLVTGDLSGPQDLKYLIAGSLQKKKSLRIHVLEFLKNAILGWTSAISQPRFPIRIRKGKNQIRGVIEYTGADSGLCILGSSVNTTLRDIFE